MFADQKQHGNTRWTLAELASMALLWTLSEKSTWRRRFAQAQRALGSVGQGDPATFEGFRQALKKRNEQLRPLLVERLREAMQQLPPTVRQIGGWEVFASDGTRLALPRTWENQEHFCVAGASEAESSDPQAARRSNPQMWLTTLWHVGLALPWDWRTGPGNSSERDHLREMLSSLPENALVVADAGFVGYDLWESVQQTAAFLVRVGSNIHLINDLQPTDDPAVVSFWPSEARRAGQPPLQLRLIQVQIGKERVYLVTNVLDEARLSDEQAKEIYRRRWGVELFYRGLKQTLGRRKLLGRTPASAQMELDWSLLGLWMIHLLSVQETVAARPVRAQAKPLPARSTRRLLDAVRDALESPQERPPAGKDLGSRLRAALADTYQRRRPKASRNYPRPQKHTRCEPPVIRSAKPEERSKLRRMQLKGQLTTAI